MSIFDLMYGNIQVFSNPNWFSKWPTLLGYFPLYLYSDNHNKIPSLGGTEQILLMNNGIHNQNCSFFSDLPSPVLIYSKFYGWKTNEILNNTILPRISYTIDFKFDILTSVKRDPSKTIAFSESYNLLSFIFQKDSSEYKFYLNTSVTLESTNDLVFTGAINYEIQWKKLGNENKKNFTLLVVTSSSNPFVVQNKCEFPCPYLTSRQVRMGLRSVLSPQNLIIKVLYLMFIINYVKQKTLSNNIKADFQPGNFRNSV